MDTPTRAQASCRSQSTPSGGLNPMDWPPDMCRSQRRELPYTPNPQPKKFRRSHVTVEHHATASGGLQGTLQLGKAIARPLGSGDTLVAAATKRRKSCFKKKSQVRTRTKRQKEAPYPTESVRFISGRSKLALLRSFFVMKGRVGLSCELTSFGVGTRTQVVIGDSGNRRVVVSGRAPLSLVQIVLTS